MQLRSLRPGAGRADVERLERRVADLEADLAELRQHHLRLAEVADVVQELLVPLASRDEAALQEAVERFRESL